MDQAKLHQAVEYLLEKHGGRLNYTKLIELLYLADREMINQTGYPITGDSYCLVKNGPVLSRVYDLIRGDKVTNQTKAPGIASLKPRDTTSSEVSMVSLTNSRSRKLSGKTPPNPEILQMPSRLTQSGAPLGLPMAR